MIPDRRAVPRGFRARSAQLLCGALLAAVAAPALALEGRVVLPDGTPVAGATVSILGSPGSTRTDRNGTFRWEPDPAPPFQVLVVLRSGQTMAPHLVGTLPAAGPLIVRVEPLVRDRVTVSAEAAPHLETPPASGLTLLAREDLEQRRPLRLTEALEDVPGAGRLEEGHSVVPSLRGLARGRTLILLDGARITAERRAGPSATYLDPLFLEGVEVSRGPGSVAYGSDAFGGVIDARTRRPDWGSPLAVRFQGTLGEGLPERGAGVEVGRGFAEGGLIVQARGRDFDEYRSPRGEVFNSGARDRGLLVRASRAAGPGVLTLGWQSDQGRAIGKPATDSRVTRAFYPREDSHRLTAEYDVTPAAGFSEIALGLFAGGYRLVLDRDRFATPAAPRRLSRADVRARDFGLRAGAERPVGRGRIEFGADLNGRFGVDARGVVLDFDAAGDFSARAEEMSIESARRIDAALYGTGEAPLGPVLVASGGLRVDRVGARNRGGFFGDRATRNTAASGFVALTARPAPGLSATLQAARGFRDPTLSDRYFRGVSGRGFVTGNPDLDPETSRQYDLAVRLARGALRAGLFAYRYDIVDLIERFEPAPDEFAFRNRGRARLKGLELEIGIETRRGTGVSVGMQAATGEALDDGAPLADVPPRGLTVRLRQRVRDRGYVMLRAAAYARDDDPGPTERTTPGYLTLDAGGGARLGTNAELRVLLRNLTDQAYPASPDEKAVLAPGRSGAVILALGF